MDGQNFQNEQGTQNTETTQNNFYQDNTGMYSTPQPAPTYYSAPEQPKQQTSALAVVGLVLGIISILFACCFGVTIFLGIAGIICSALALKKGKSGIATAALICSIVGTIFSLISVIYWVTCFVIAASDPSIADSIYGSSYY